MASDNIIDFGLEDTGLINKSGCDAFKQSRPNEKSIISIVSLQTLHKVLIGRKQRETQVRMSDSEMAEFNAKVDSKLAEKHGKKVSELDEIDRLDPGSPRFAMSRTHYSEAVGTIRCLSEYIDKNVSKQGMCCKHMGDAGQLVSCVVMQYPIDKERGTVDLDIFKLKKQVNFWIWKLSPKKYDTVMGIYSTARNEENPIYTLDLMVELDGDPKYQKQKISRSSSASWARKDTPADVRRWVLENGLRYTKYMPDQLGYKMNEAKLAEKLGISASVSHDYTQSQLSESTESAVDYKSMID